jgi:protocatechuate 3,4-dioxygenase beta subunit
MILSAAAIALVIGQLPTGAPAHQVPEVAPASITVLAQEEGSGVPLEGVTITVASPGSTTLAYKASTFSNGTVQFTGLAPGLYVVLASSSELLPSAASGDLRRVVKVAEGENAIIVCNFRRPAAIRGQLLTAEGKPVLGATVEVVMTKSQVRGHPVVAAGPGSTTDAEGRFKIEKLAPGRYLVRARLPAPADAPLNFVYGPRTTAVSEATPIELQAGDEVAVGITALAVPAVPVSGRVVDTAGDPVPDAIVSLTSLDEETAPAAYFGPGGLHRPAAVNTPESVRTDRSGRFVVRGVRQGLYALQAVVRGTGLGTPVVQAGVAEVDILASTIDSLTIKLVPCARITGRFLFNGLETTDPDRSVVEMRPDGEDAHLREGLAATTTNWLADGTFVIDGLLGRHRLTVRSSGNWFTVAASLETGTDILTGPVDFEPGKTYSNVRVLLSDETAEIEGLLPEDWSANSPPMIVAFPEDMSLWQETQRYVQLGNISGQTRRFSVKRIPPGHVYLVAAYPFIDPREPQAQSRDVMELLNQLSSRATRIFIGGAGKFEVTLSPPPRDR